MADRFLSQRVYFIQSGDSGPIKVGISDDPASRRRHLQTASHEPLYLLGEVPGGEEREKQIHAYLAEFRIRGEWFSPDPVVWAIVPGQRAIEMLQQMLGTDRIGASGFKLKHILAMRTGKPRSPEIEAEISRLQVGGL